MVAEVAEILRSAEAVCFDVDSTVVVDEGIDKLADVCGVGEEVTNWYLRCITDFHSLSLCESHLFSHSLCKFLL